MPFEKRTPKTTQIFDIIEVFQFETQVLKKLLYKTTGL